MHSGAWILRTIWTGSMEFQTIWEAFEGLLCTKRWFTHCRRCLNSTRKLIHFYCVNFVRGNFLVPLPSID